MDSIFDTSGGRFRVELSSKSLTSYGGLVAFAAFLERLGVIEHLVATCPVTFHSNNATPVRDILCRIHSYVYSGR
jgi:hypothetical protein